MGWTIGEEALPTDLGGAVNTTSTSTLCLVGSTGYARLRMYGADPYAVANALRGADTSYDVSEVQEPAPPWTPVGVPIGPTIGFIDSPSVVAATASAADYAFTILRRSTSGTYPMGATVIPQQKAALVLDGELCQPLYKDVHVIQLRDGLGYLMLAARYWAAGTLFGPGLDSPSPENSKSAIVGFWAPATDPDFASPDVVGPVFVVSRVQEVDGVTAAVWIGVPSMVEADEGGEGMVYVYYTAEHSQLVDDASLTPPATFVPGTRMRSISRAELLGAFGTEASAATEPTEVVPFTNTYAELAEEVAVASAAMALGGFTAAAVASAKLTLGRINLAAALESDMSVGLGDGAAESLGGGRDASTLLWPPELCMNEEVWRSASGAWLVPGTLRGKVRLWMATGDPFVAGDAPLTTNNRGNVPLWNRYFTIHDVDAQPVWAGEQLLLFVSANAGDRDRQILELRTEQEADSIGYGVYRCVALPADVAGEFGIDFVIHDFNPAGNTALTERDLVTRSTPVGGDANSVSVMRLDPDPVQLPDGDWLLFNGAIFLERNSAPDADVSAPWSDAWT